MNVKLFNRLCRDSIAVDGCWFWQLFSDKTGGQVHWSGKMQYVRRLALELVGRSADGNVSPSCGNPRCWNPQHLITITRRTPAEACAHVLAQVLQINTCLWFPGSKDKNGYGRVNAGGKIVEAHRLVYEQLVGPFPRGMVLDHLCQNPACVNVEHLEPITVFESLRRLGNRRHALREAESLAAELFDAS